MLVFLAASARAGVVATNFGPRANGFGALDGSHGFADHVACPWSGCAVRIGARRRTTECCRALVQCLLRRIAQEILERYQRLSKPFGTQVVIDDNVGIVRM